MEKLIIAITGKNGSGKDSVADYLVSKYGAEKMVFSDMLREALSIFIDPEDISRSDMAWLSTGLREKYGQGVLAEGMKRRIMLSNKDIVVVSGVRDFGELEMIRSFPNNILIVIEADAEIRWKRMIARQEKADDNISFEAFLDREKLESESMINDLSLKADYRIANNEQKDHLLAEVDKIMENYKK